MLVWVHDANFYKVRLSLEPEDTQMIIKIIVLFIAGILLGFLMGFATSEIIYNFIKRTRK